MSLRHLIDKFYDELWRYCQERFDGNASMAAAALGISKNKFTVANRGARGQGVHAPRPHAAVLRRCRDRGDQALTQAAGRLLVAYEPQPNPNLIICDVPPELSDWLQRQVISFEEFQRVVATLRHNPPSRRDVPTLIKRYTHAALQLETGGFVNGALEFGLGEDADLGALEAYAIQDLIQGFGDFRYFQKLAAALGKRQGSVPNPSIPLHPLGVLELSTIMREPALLTEDPDLKLLRRLTRADGRRTCFIFHQDNSRRPRPTPSEIVSLVGPDVSQPGALLNRLTAQMKHVERELPEPAVVRAGASIAAMRLALSLIAATTTLIGLEQMSQWLEAVASKVGELCRYSYDDLEVQMHENLGQLSGDESELDRTVLEAEVALTLTALL